MLHTTRPLHRQQARPAHDRAPSQSDQRTESNWVACPGKVGVPCLTPSLSQSHIALPPSLGLTPLTQGPHHAITLIRSSAFPRYSPPRSSPRVLRRRVSPYVGVAHTLFYGHLRSYLRDQINPSFHTAQRLRRSQSRRIRRHTAVSRTAAAAAAAVAAAAVGGGGDCNYTCIVIAAAICNYTVITTPCLGLRVITQPYSLR